MTDDLRTDPPLAADERTTLRAFLDFHRDTLRAKTAGLDADGLAATLAPSDMTLGGMLRHLTFVEHWWFEQVFLGREAAEPWASVDWGADPDWEWHTADRLPPEDLRSSYDEQVARSDAVLDAAPDWDALSQRPSRGGEPFSLRWVVVHMLEEYARHNGHADLIRQSVDGRVGE